MTCVVWSFVSCDWVVMGAVMWISLYMFFCFVCSRFLILYVFFFSSRRRHTRCLSDWSSDVCSSDLLNPDAETAVVLAAGSRDNSVGEFFLNRGGHGHGENVAAEQVRKDRRGDSVEIGRASCRERG